MASSVVIGRIAFILLGFVTFVTVIRTIIADGSPFRLELLTPWMTATLIDFYVNIAAISVWVWYKESSWITALIITVLLICLGSITTCWYIAWKLFQVPTHEPIYLVLLREEHWRVLGLKKRNGGSSSESATLTDSK